MCAAYTHKTIRALLTITLVAHPNSTQWNFNSCSFNYKSDHIIPYSQQWRHTHTQSAHPINARVAPLRWRVYPPDQILTAVRKSLIYAPTSLQWVKWIAYSSIIYIRLFCEALNRCIQYCLAEGYLDVDSIVKISSTHYYSKLAAIELKLKFLDFRNVYRKK